MNSQTQTDNQTSQPADFDFIMKQNPENPAKKPLDKRIIIIGVLFVLIIIIFIAGAIMSSQGNVKKADNAQVTQSVKAEDKAIILAFLNAVASDNPDEAYALFDSSNPITQQEFMAEGVPFLQNFNLSKCQLPAKQVVETSPSGDAQTTTTVTCNLKSNGYGFGVAFSLVDRDGIPKIGFYKFMESQ